MVKIIIVKRNADIEEKNIRSFSDDTLYKSCNLKSNQDFGFIHCYELDNEYRTQYEIYGKKTGRANTENKYELPPPIDTVLLFGSLCIIKKDKDGNVHDLTSGEWNTVYESLYGGFEDICDEEDEIRSMDSLVYGDEDYTNEGYLKDGFVIDNDELEPEDYLSSSSEE